MGNSINYHFDQTQRVLLYQGYEDPHIAWGGKVGVIFMSIARAKTVQDMKIYTPVFTLHMCIVRGGD